MVILKCLCCSTPTTGYTFASAGYLPIEMVFFAENSLPSLTVRWQGPSDTIFTVRVTHSHTHTHTHARCLQISTKLFHRPFVSCITMLLCVHWQRLIEIFAVMQVVEGNSLQFNCSSIQNNTNSAPAKSSSMCSGLSAVYYANWAVSLLLLHIHHASFCVSCLLDWQHA